MVSVISAAPLPIEDLALTLQREARLLGLDVGTKTVGLALSDVTCSIATPYETLRRTKFTADAKTIAGIVEEMGVGGLVIGMPYNLDGSEGPRAQSTRARLMITPHCARRSNTRRYIGGPRERFEPPHLLENSSSIKHIDRRLRIIYARKS